MRSTNLLASRQTIANSQHHRQTFGVGSRVTAKITPHAKRFVALVFLTCFPAACQSPSSQQADISAAHSPVIEHAKPLTGKEIEHLLKLTNQARAAKRLPPLSVDPRLTRAALDHSRSMSRHTYFDHVGRDGSNFQARMLRHGYPTTYCAENIAMAHDPGIVFQMWTQSQGHAKNMFNKKYARIGIGRAGNYWTAVYAAPDKT